MVISRVLWFLTVPVFVVACAPKPAPQVIYGQPIYNKLGDQVGCESGIYIPGAPPEEQCVPPPDDCNPRSTAASFDPNCRPPSTRDDDRPNGNVPGAAPNRNRDP